MNCLLCDSLTLKMETVHSSITFVNFYRAMLHHIPEGIIIRVTDMSTSDLMKQAPTPPCCCQWTVNLQDI